MVHGKTMENLLEMAISMASFPFTRGQCHAMVRHVSTLTDLPSAAPTVRPVLCILHATYAQGPRDGDGVNGQTLTPVDLGDS